MINGDNHYRSDDHDIQHHLLNGITCRLKYIRRIIKYHIHSAPLLKDGNENSQQ